MTEILVNWWKGASKTVLPIFFRADNARVDFCTTVLLHYRSRSEANQPTLDIFKSSMTEHSITDYTNIVSE